MSADETMGRREIEPMCRAVWLAGQFDMTLEVDPDTYCVCTLRSGHAGNHEAHGSLPEDRLVVSWSADEQQEPLDLDWIRQFLADTLNTDFLSPYQREIVGEVPEPVLRWADVPFDWADA